MIIRPDNISIDKDIIDNIRAEILPLDDRDKFFNDLINKRLRKCNDNYLEDIDKDIDRLMSSIDDMSILDIKKTITSVDRKFSRLYKSQMSLYQILANIN